MIDASGISYQIGKRKILEDISISIGEGEFWLVFGPNGAGKTTLLRIMAGIIREFRGNIFLRGKEIKAYHRKELAMHIAYLPQEEGFGYPVLVQDLLLAGRYPYRGFFTRFTLDDKERVEQIARQMGLATVLNREIQTLSSGERKKVLLASALVQDVSFILLDEPLNFLDPKASRQLIHLLDNLRYRGKTIVAVSHFVEHFYPWASHLLALKEGKVIYAGEKIFSPAILSATYEVSFQQLRHGNREIIFINE